MLNKLLERLPLLLSEGIDYKATKDAMQKAQEESRHLWQFAREVGLEVQSGGRVWITDLWDLLVDWYEGMGVLDKELDGKGNEKLIWHELSNKYDAPVKSINQLSSRFSEIFPKVQVCKYYEREEIERRSKDICLELDLCKSPRKLQKRRSHRSQYIQQGFRRSQSRSQKILAPTLAPTLTAQKPLRREEYRVLAPMAPTILKFFRTFAIRFPNSPILISKN
jgi:phage/plasmid-associated DNA primase